MLWRRLAVLFPPLHFIGTGVPLPGLSPAAPGNRRCDRGRGRGFGDRRGALPGGGPRRKWHGRLFLRRPGEIPGDRPQRGAHSAGLCGEGGRGGKGSAMSCGSGRGGSISGRSDPSKPGKGRSRPCGCRGGTAHSFFTIWTRPVLGSSKPGTYSPGILGAYTEHSPLPHPAGCRKERLYAASVHPPFFPPPGPMVGRARPAANPPAFQAAGTGLAAGARLPPGPLK